MRYSPGTTRLSQPGSRHVAPLRECGARSMKKRGGRSDVELEDSPSPRWFRGSRFSNSMKSLTGRNLIEGYRGDSELQEGSELEESCFGRMAVGSMVDDGNVCK